MDGTEYHFEFAGHPEVDCKEIEQWKEDKEDICDDPARFRIDGDQNKQDAQSHRAADTAAGAVPGGNLERAGLLEVVHKPVNLCAACGHPILLALIVWLVGPNAGCKWNEGGKGHEYDPWYTQDGDQYLQGYTCAGPGGPDEEAACKGQPLEAKGKGDVNHGGSFSRLIRTRAAVFMSFPACCQ